MCVCFAAGSGRAHKSARQRNCTDKCMLCVFPYFLAPARAEPSRGQARKNRAAAAAAEQQHSSASALARQRAQSGGDGDSARTVVSLALAWSLEDRICARVPGRLFSPCGAGASLESQTADFRPPGCRTEAGGIRALLCSHRAFTSFRAGEAKICIRARTRTKCCLVVVAGETKRRSGKN